MILDNQNRCAGVWFVQDFCGILCVIFTWILIIYAQYSVITCIILPETDKFYQIVNFIIFEVLLNLATISHLKCVFTDPGTVPRGTANREAIEALGLDEDSMKTLFKCQKCCAIKPQRAHHCSVCNRCIKKMDHHCPWINSCVGQNNQKYFILFTLYIALVSTYSLVITVVHLINCIKNNWSHCDSRPLFSIFTSSDYSDYDSKSTHATPYSIILIVILIFESLLFAIFTIIMFTTQIQCIFNDQTGIENLKKKNNHNPNNKINRSFLKRLRILLTGFNLQWLNPLTQPIFTSNLDLKCYTHYV